MSRWIPYLASTFAVVGVITAEDFALPGGNFLTPSASVSAAADPDADAKPKPVVVTVHQQVEVADESGLRQKLARLHAEHAKLYTGDELAALITQAEQAIEDRKTELAERKKSFDEKIDAVRTQLEELKREAAAVGADVPMGLILKAIDEAKKAEGQPRPTKTDFNDDFLTPQIPRFDDFAPSYAPPGDKAPRSALPGPKNAPMRVLNF